VNALVRDPSLFPVVLYPGEGSTNLSELEPGARESLFPRDKELLVFVIDGTWITARKTMQRCPNLGSLPRVCFTPDRPSRFRVRRQPRPECYSTAEAIHQAIELLGPGQGFDLTSRRHDVLLEVFERMVDRHLELAPPKDQQKGRP
jgi:DTW domain-containing protein